VDLVGSGGNSGKMGYHGQFPDSQTNATAEIIQGQNALITGLQQHVGFLEDEVTCLERKIQHIAPPAYTPRAEVIDLTSDEDSEDDDIVIVELVLEEVRVNPLTLFGFV